ncbi:MAG: hypothetical protein WAL98_14825 [Desulfatiglandaceae bacterium]|jgi:hypothetical protein
MPQAAAYELRRGAEPDTLFQTLSHGALAPNTDMDDYLGFTSPNPTRFYEFTLNPNSASIPSEVFRKGPKKSVRFGSLTPADETT